VPGLSLELRRFDEQHCLHALDTPIPVGKMSGCDLREYAADLAVAGVLLHDGTDVVRLMDTEDVVKDLFIGKPRWKRLQVIAWVTPASKE